MAEILKKMGTTLEMIKWEHSIFALPFALTAMLLAAHGLPGWRIVAWIVVAMVSARSAAMAFNPLGRCGPGCGKPADAEPGDSRGNAVAAFRIGFYLRGFGGFPGGSGRIEQVDAGVDSGGDGGAAGL